MIFRSEFLIWMDASIGKPYCWWKKSCTSWYGKYPIIYRVSYIPGGAGFLPSTVSSWIRKTPCNCGKAKTWCDSLILACLLNHEITQNSIAESSFACSSSIQISWGAWRKVWKEVKKFLPKSCRLNCEKTKNQVIQFVPFSSPSWRSLNPLKGSLNHPKKVTLNHQVPLLKKNQKQLKHMGGDPSDDLDLFFRVSLAS